jgi:uncharacterized membrane protein
MVSFIRASRGSRAAAVLAAVSLFLVACNQVGSANLTFWDVIWSMIFFFFWFMAIWIFIQIFADIFRRDDLSGAMKAVWIIVLVFLPFLGALIYILSRPKVTAQDVQMLTQMEAAQGAAAKVSTADELEKLNQLKAAGVISDAEFQSLKSKLMG